MADYYLSFLWYFLLLSTSLRVLFDRNYQKKVPVPITPPLMFVIIFGTLLTSFLIVSRNDIEALRTFSPALGRVLLAAAFVILISAQFKRGQLTTGHPWASQIPSLIFFFFVNAFIAFYTHYTFVSNPYFGNKLSDPLLLLTPICFGLLGTVSFFFGRRGSQKTA